MADKTKVQEVKSKVSIPAYFYNIIIPQRADYYSDYPVDFDSKPVVKCPVHDEDTPSMRFYDETNTFYCFGCKAGGDVIELHRVYTHHMTDQFVSFDDSVDFLYNYFIKGNENAQAIKLRSSLLSDTPLSTQVELVRYSNYAKLLENQLLVDNAIEEQSKRNIWDAIDMVNVLLASNEINAIDGMRYVKQVVSRSKWRV